MTLPAPDEIDMEAGCGTGSGDGALVGEPAGSVGSAEGRSVGVADGSAEARSVGVADGSAWGCRVGFRDGLTIAGGPGSTTRGAVVSGARGLRATGWVSSGSGTPRGARTEATARCTGSGSLLEYAAATPPVATATTTASVTPVPRRRAVRLPAMPPTR